MHENASLLNLLWVYMSEFLLFVCFFNTSDSILILTTFIIFSPFGQGLSLEFSLMDHAVVGSDVPQYLDGPVPGFWSHHMFEGVIDV